VSPHLKIINFIYKSDGIDTIMSKVCTKCTEPIDRDHYICKYPFDSPCECILHPCCFQNAKESVSILLKCKCHPWHIDSFVHVQVAEGTSEDKKKPDFQEHPDNMVYYLDTNGYQPMNRSEMLKVQEIDDSTGIPSRRGI
jgi:hypothetical protein